MTLQVAGGAAVFVGVEAALLLVATLLPALRLSVVLLGINDRAKNIGVVFAEKRALSPVHIALRINTQLTRNA